ncbi:hypothetical protein MTO96_008042 [Rhipicephalus appendiculatus]
MTNRPRRVDALLAEALESSGTRARGDVGDKNPNAAVQLLLRLRLMFADSAIPGLRVILGLSHPLRRLAWTAALAALVCVGLNDLYVVFREYFEYADTVDVMWARSPEGMALPAVTFCNVNQVRWSVFCGDIELNRSTATRMAGENLQEQVIIAHLVLVHSVGSLMHFLERHLQVKVYGRYGNCFCLGCNLSAEREKIQTAYSPDQGVRLLLNLEINEYLPHTTEAGFVVSVHQPGVQVDFRDSIFLLPCHTTMISVTQACRQICAQLHVIAACGCQSHDYDTVDRSLADICNEDDEELNKCTAEVSERIDGGKVECPCLESCTVIEYSWQASSLKWTKHILEEQKVPEHEIGKHDKVLTEVVVYLASAQEYRRRNDPKVTASTTTETL